MHHPWRGQGSGLRKPNRQRAVLEVAPEYAALALDHHRPVGEEVLACPATTHCRLVVLTRSPATNDERRDGIVAVSASVNW